MNRTDAIWAVGRATIGTATKLVAPLRVYGAERVPLEGGLVVAANHFSWIDPPALGAAIPRTLYFMAKVEAHRVPGLGQLMRSFGAFSVRRGESDRDAVRTMREIVRDGHALGLFVEGTRQRSGVPGPVQPGAAMVAINEDAPVICAAIYGSLRVASRELQARVRRMGEPADVRRSPAWRQGVQGGVGRDRARDQEALGVACGRARARTAARRDAAVMTGRRRRRRDRRHGRDRRLPERREVDADQPPDRDAHRRRPRDTGRHARPQGASLRMVGHDVPPHRHGRRRPRRRRAVRPADRRAGAPGGRGGRPRALRRRRESRA